MKDWPVLEKIFPFKCNTPKCGELSSREFRSAALNMGYIWLANENFFIIGLTCPKCLQTTINKYSVDVTDFEISQFDNFQNFIPFPSENFQNRIPTPSNILYHLPPRYLFSEQDPSDFHPKPILNYPEWFNSRCIYYIDENEVPEILKYENEKQERVFPRIIGDDSVYNWTDAFLCHLQSPEALMVNFERTPGPTLLQDLLINMAKNYLSIGYNVETEFTPERMKVLAIEFPIAQNFSEDFMETVRELIPEYDRKRNAIDFDLKFKTDFLDKYINKLFYIKDYRTSPIRRYHKAEYEKAMGIPEMLDKSEHLEKLSSGEILSRWKKDAPFLKSAILNGDLCAYWINGIRFDPATVQQTPGNISPDDYIFIKTDVEKFESERPWLKKEVVEEEQEPLTGPERRKIGELLRENEKLKQAIDSAVKMGIWVSGQEGPLLRKDCSDALRKIQKNTPDTIFDIIWKAFPTEKKWAGGKPRGTPGKKKEDF